MSNCVSVVIPVHNAAAWLGTLLESVSKQVNVTIQIVIIDDGSTDDSALIAEDFRRNHSEIEMLYVRQDNRGVASARNLGISKASHDWVALVDSDDVWFQEKLSKQIRFAESFGLNAVATGYVMFRDSSNQIVGTVFPDWSKKAVFDWLLMRRYGGLLSSTLLIKKTVFDQVGFFSPTLSLSADVEFAWRLVNHTKVGVVREVLVAYRLRLNQMHKNQTLLLEEAERMISLVPVLDFSVNSKSLKSNLLLRLGLYNLISRNFSDCRVFLIRSARTDLSEFCTTLIRISINRLKLRMRRLFATRTLKFP